MVALYTNAGPAEEVEATEVMTETETVTETESVTETEAVAEEDAGATIVDVTWQWIATEYSDDTTLTVDDPSRYTMVLHADGTVTLQVDCNRGGGTYSLDGSLLSLEVAEMT